VTCGHPLCELIGGSCSLGSRSRGCTAVNGSRDLDPDLLDEVRGLLATIDPSDASTRPAAIRLAAIIRSEAFEDRQLLALLRVEEPELAPVLARLCTRR
jgi:hypothetical protein